MGKANFLFNQSLRRGFATAFNGPKYILFFGAPGVGKGTYARLLSKDIGIKTFSTGDAIRQMLKEGGMEGMETAVFENIKGTVQSGGLLGDDLVFEIVKARLVQEDAKTDGLILDGFPRTVSQCQLLDTVQDIDLVVNFGLRRDLLIKKLAGRLVCDDCGRNYNDCEINDGEYVMDPLLPEVAGVCDSCGGHLSKRPDDAVEVIQKRLEVYDATEQPLLDFYTAKGNMHDIHVKKGIKDYDKIKEQIINLLQQKSASKGWFICPFRSSVRQAERTNRQKT